VVIPVTLNIVNPNAISVGPITPFTDIIGGTVAPYLPAAQNISVTVTNGPALPLAATVTGANGLGSQQIPGLFTASLASNGSPTSGTTLTVGITPSVVATLGAGTYTANISVTAPNVGTVNVPVQVTVYAAPVISPLSALAFFSTINGFTVPAPPQSVSPVFTGLPPVDSFGFSASVATGASFLSVTNAGVPFTVSVTQPGTAGVSNGSITISGPAGSGVAPVTFPVSLTVYAQPVIASASAMSLSYTIGQTPAPVSAIIPMAGTTGTGTLSGLNVASQTGNCGWLVGGTASLSSATLPSNLTFAPLSPGALNSMLPGSYTCSVTIGGGTTGALGAPAIPGVETTTLTILPQPLINAAATPVVLTSPNGTLSAQIIVSTSNPVGLTVTSATTVVTPLNGTWLSASLSGSGSTQTLLITANPAGLANGTYTGSVALNANNGATFPANQVTIPVTLLVGPVIKKTELGVFRTGNTFLLDSNGNNTYDASDLYITSFVPTGGFVAGDIPVSGDWTGTGLAKVGVYRPSTGTWWLDANGDGVLDAGDVTTQFGGIAGDKPVVGDWNGSGTSKIGIFRQGFFWILDTNGNGVFDSGDAAFAFGGITGDQPVVGDWTGNGISKVGLVREYAPAGVPQGNPFFWVLDAQNNHTSGFITFAYGGLAGDVFVTGDWNGTGTAKPAVYRTGTWIESLSPSYTYDTFYQYGGLAGDVPLVGFKGWR
jgi:hypothetical protein